MPVAADISELLIRVIIADNAIVDQQSTLNTGDDWWFSMGNIRLLYCTAITRFGACRLFRYSYSIKLHLTRDL